jgi:hypothetical protein
MSKVDEKYYWPAPLAVIGGGSLMMESCDVDLEIDAVLLLSCYFYV